MRQKLRKGFTTGSCAAAAAKAAALTFFSGNHVQEVTITLPAGAVVTFPLFSCIRSKKFAECSLLKDAGDDPDVTNGIEIKAKIQQIAVSGRALTITGGEGVGIVTKPGLPVTIGEYAINPVPLQMIHDAVIEVLKQYPGQSNNHYKVTIEVPKGKEVAKRTLNSRLGIIKGISILGTTGIVEPMSLAAYQSVIDTCLNIARASTIEEIVFTPGRTTQKAAERYFSFKKDAFIQIGDHVGYALRQVFRKQISKIIIVGQLGKLTKIAQGNFDTHAYRSTINFSKASGWAEELSFSENEIAYIASCNTMAQATDYLSQHDGERFFQAVCTKVCDAALTFLEGTGVLPEDIDSFRCVLVSSQGEVLADVSKN